MTISAIVFDFDGVLADSEPLHLRAYQEVFTARGAQMSRDEYCSTYLGFDDDGVFRRFAAERGWTLSEEQIAELIAEKSRVLERMVASGDVLYPAAAPCVTMLAERYPLGIASGAFKHEIEDILDRARLRHHFQFVVGSGDTPRGKPAPDPYSLAARLHHVLPQACVAIEDSHWGIESARAAGLKCIGITNTYPRAQLSEADVVIDALDELTPALIRSL
jgi:beta-phosphoglucomutase